MAVDFEDGINSKTVEAATTDINRGIKQVLPDVCRVFIEAESWSAHQRQQAGKSRLAAATEQSD